MDIQILKLIVIGAVLLCIFGVVPLVMALLRHQQEMAELFAKNNTASNELAAKLESLEQKLNELQLGTGREERTQESLPNRLRQE